MAGLIIRQMTLDDYEDVRALWSASPGVGLSPADSREGVEQYLRANPGTSMVALAGGKLVGAVLCGHDGRRGYLSHLAVADSHRRTGVASRLVDRCISALQHAGIDKCHIVVFRDNEGALAFYRATGWFDRDELAFLSRFTGDDVDG